MTNAFCRRVLAAALALLLGVAAVSAQEDVEAVCGNPLGRCAGAISPACLRLGAGSLDADCQAEQARYSVCLQEVAALCGGRAGLSEAGDGAAEMGCSAEVAQDLWAAAREDRNCAGYQGFIASCPTDARVGFASTQLSALGCVDGGTEAPSSAATAPEPTPAAVEPAPATTPVAAPEAVPDAAPEPAPEPEPAIGPAEYRAAQGELRRLRLYAGPIDGDWGPGSRGALRAFQEQTGRAQTGALTTALLTALRATPTPPAPEPAPAPTARRAEPAPEGAPARPAAGSAEIQVEVAHRRAAGLDCSFTVPRVDGRVSLVAQVFACGRDEIKLSLETTADGGLVRAGRIDTPLGDAVLRGTGWRFVGRERVVQKATVTIRLID